jgi:hypothetical protein
MSTAVFPRFARHKNEDNDDIPLPPGQEPRAPVEDPPDSPQVEPPGPVREPEDTPDRRLAAQVRSRVSTPGKTASRFQARFRKRQIAVSQVHRTCERPRMAHESKL